MRSILPSDFEDFEVILVDDGSTDATVDRARAALPDSRLRVLQSDGRGLVSALNTGLSACVGPWVARMDADDLALPGRLSRQLAFLDRHPAVDLLGCGVESFRDDGAPLGGGFARYDAWQNGLLTHADIAREMFVESPLVHPTVVYRREAIEGLGGYRDGDFPEDHDLWLRALAAGLTFAKVPEVLLRWRDHDARATRVDARYEDDKMVACRIEHLVRGPLAGVGSVVIWGAGRYGRRLGRMLTAHGISTDAFVDIDPKKLAHPVQGSPVVTPEALGGPDDRRLLAAVGSVGARALIRAHLEASGWTEGRDWWAVR